MSETPRAGSNNSDLHDLRYRISQLEHLFVNATINSSENGNPFSPAVELRAVQTQHELVSRISDLEGLLAASELENNHLRQELAVFDMDKKRDDVILLEKLYAKDKDNQRLENEVRLLETKLGKAERNMENVKEYINSLPSQDELDEAKESVVKLESDNHVLSQKGSSLECQLRELHKELGEKNRLIEDQLSRLEEIQPLEEAQSSILRSTEEGSLDLQNERHITELITVQKAQILKSAKLISTLREKLNKCQLEKDDLHERISSQASQVEKLQEDLLVGQLTLEKTVQKLKMTEQERIALYDEKAQLQNVLEDRERFIRERDSQFANIIKLVTEIDLCVSDVRKLVELGESIARGEEPAVSSLLGLSDELEMHLRSLNEEVDESHPDGMMSTSFNNSNKNDQTLVGKYLASLSNGVSNSLCEEFSLGDMEWVLDRIKKIRDLRQNIGVIRDQVNDVYTDMLGGKTEGCSVQ